MNNPMKLNELYRELSRHQSESQSFIANVIYTGYRKNRKKMLQGLYNIINGGPRHYWAPCHVTFAPFNMETILATPDNGDSIKEVDINNLVHFA